MSSAQLSSDRPTGTPAGPAHVRSVRWRERVRAAERGGYLGDPYVPYQNPPARLAYASGVAGLLPILGLPLGTLALASGWLGLRRARRLDDQEGIGHAVMGLILGAAELLVNGVGLTMIARGLHAW